MMLLIKTSNINTVGVNCTFGEIPAAHVLLQVMERAWIKYVNFLLQEEKIITDWCLQEKKKQKEHALVKF